MENLWYLLGLLGWAIALLLAFVLVNMAARQDRIARRAESMIRLNPESSATNGSARAGADDTRPVPADRSHPG